MSAIGTVAGSVVVNPVDHGAARQQLAVAGLDSSCPGDRRARRRGRRGHVPDLDGIVYELLRTLLPISPAPANLVVRGAEKAGS